MKYNADNLQQSFIRTVMSLIGAKLVVLHGKLKSLGFFTTYQE